MVSKKVCFALMFVSLMLTLSMVSAITATIGNSRMILRVDVNEEIERSILIRNTNNQTVLIDIFVTGDLKDSLSLAKNELTLAPGEEEKVYFTVSSPLEGTQTTSINVQFTPEGGGDGVGLTSTVIVIAGSGDADSDDDDDDDNSRSSSRDDDSDNDDNSVPAESTDDSVSESSSFFDNGLDLFFSEPSVTEYEQTSSPYSNIVTLFLVVVLLLVILLTLLIKKKSKSKKEVRSR